MPDTFTRPIDESYARVLENMRGHLQLCKLDPGEAPPATLVELFGIDAGPMEYPQDEAVELASTYVYEITRLAVLDDEFGGNPDIRSVELLLGGGGPTIHLTADVRDDEVREVVYDHSWGAGTGEAARISDTSWATCDLLTQWLTLIGALNV
jgi:hypothetical protein